MFSTAQKLDHIMVTQSNPAIFLLLVIQDFQVHTTKELLTKCFWYPLKSIKFLNNFHCFLRKNTVSVHTWWSQKKARLAVSPAEAGTLLVYATVSSIVRYLKWYSMCTVSLKYDSKTIKQHGVSKETTEALQTEVKHKMQRRIIFTTEEVLNRYWRIKRMTKWQNL